MRALLLVVCWPALAAASEEAWLDGLYRRVAEDLKAGRPLVATVHVALCSNPIIRCGGGGLGDGDDLRRNLYWATTGGLDGWFSRPGSGWRRARVEAGTGPVLRTVVWERRITPGPGWQRFGVTKPFTLQVVARAWRGSAIDAALDAFVGDLYGDGASHLVAFVGHNRFMDRPKYDFPATAHGAPRGMMTFACATAGYLAREVSSELRVPLVLTTDLMFASSPAFDYAARAFATAADYATLRRAAGEGYAAESHKPVARCTTLFTNPSHAKWPR